MSILEPQQTSRVKAQTQGTLSLSALYPFLCATPTKTTVLWGWVCVLHHYLFRQGRFQPDTFLCWEDSTADRRRNLFPQAHGRSPFTRDTGDRGHNISEASDSRARPLDDGSGGKRNLFPPPQTPNFNVDSVRVNAAVVLTRLFNIEIGGQGNGSGGGEINSAYSTPAPLVSLVNM